MNDNALLLLHQLITEVLQSRQIIRQQQEVLNKGKKEQKPNVRKHKLPDSDNR